MLILRVAAFVPIKIYFFLPDFPSYKWKWESSSNKKQPQNPFGSKASFNNMLKNNHILADNG